MNEWCTCYDGYDHAAAQHYTDAERDLAQKIMEENKDLFTVTKDDDDIWEFRVNDLKFETGTQEWLNAIGSTAVFMWKGEVYRYIIKQAKLFGRI